MTEPEQAAPLEEAGAYVRQSASLQQPHRQFLAPGGSWPGLGEWLPGHQTRNVVFAVTWGPSLSLSQYRRHFSISVRVATVLLP